MNIKTLSAAAALTMMLTPTTVNAYTGTSIIPESVTSVFPEPDSRVNLGLNGSPRGLQEITITFRNEISVNPNCTGEACIYLEGNDTPIQTVGVSGAIIDHMEAKRGAVVFPNSCTANGSYKVTIPEGFWILEGAKPPYSEAMELYYEIKVAQRIQPDEQVAKELKEFRLEFPENDEARLLDSRKIEFFRSSSPESYPLSISVGKNSDGSNSNFISIILTDPLSEPGDYNLFIQAGAAEGISYAGGEIVSTDACMEAVYHYTVSRIDAPKIIPAEGSVDTFVPFELTIPEEPEFWFVNDKAVSFIYPVESDGAISKDASYRLTGTRVGETDKIILTIIEEGEPQASVTPKPGRYALKLASGLFSGSWNGEFINSAPFIYYYQVEGTPDGVKITPESYDRTDARGIYTIEGKKIRNTSISAGEDTLPEGVYIIDGRKKYIKNR